MAFEIERKFLVIGNFEELATEKLKILQAYLSLDNERIIRIRIQNKKAFLTHSANGMKKSISFLFSL